MKGRRCEQAYILHTTSNRLFPIAQAAPPLGILDRYRKMVIGIRFTQGGSSCRQGKFYNRRIPQKEHESFKECLALSLLFQKPAYGIPMPVRVIAGTQPTIASVLDRSTPQTSSTAHFSRVTGSSTSDLLGHAIKDSHSASILHRRGYFTISGTRRLSCPPRLVSLRTLRRPTSSDVIFWPVIRGIIPIEGKVVTIHSRWWRYLDRSKSNISPRWECSTWCARVYL